MKNTAMFCVIVSVFACATSNVSAATWVPWGGGLLWIDRDSISKREDLTFYMVGHGRQDGEGKWTLPPLSGVEGLESAVDCSTGLEWSNREVNTSGAELTDEELDMLPHQWQAGGKAEDRIIEVVCGTK